MQPKRNWLGQFVKRLRETPEGSKEWLIWSRYHRLWHRRSDEGGACGYTIDIAQAGLFPRDTADAYNDGDRDEAFHISEKLPEIKAEIAMRERAVQQLKELATAAHPSPKAS